jgi:hypothetical protein
MPKVSKDSVSAKDYGPVAESSEDLEGYRVSFVTYKSPDLDNTPMLIGLPDDQCQCPHWGYVLKGSWTHRYGSGKDETYEAGDAFYAPPGHIPIRNAPETEVLMFSPADELHKTEEVIMRNMQAMGAPQGG